MMVLLRSMIEKLRELKIYKNYLQYWDYDVNENMKMSYNWMDLRILEKIRFSILNGLGYIERLEKKSRNRVTNIFCYKTVENMVFQQFIGDKNF